MNFWSAGGIGSFFGTAVPGANGRYLGQQVLDAELEDVPGDLRRHAV